VNRGRQAATVRRSNFSANNLPTLCRLDIAASLPSSYASPADLRDEDRIESRLSCDGEREIDGG